MNLMAPVALRRKVARAHIYECYMHSFVRRMRAMPMCVGADECEVEKEEAMANEVNGDATGESTREPPAFLGSPPADEEEHATSMMSPGGASNQCSEVVQDEPEGDLRRDARLLDDTEVDAAVERTDAEEEGALSDEEGGAQIAEVLVSKAKKAFPQNARVSINCGQLGGMVAQFEKEQVVIGCDDGTWAEMPYAKALEEVTLLPEDGPGIVDGSAVGARRVSAFSCAPDGAVIGELPGVGAYIYSSATACTACFIRQMMMVPAHRYALGAS